MEISKFSEGMTGTLMEIGSPAPDHAFIPDDIPPKWTFDIELINLLAEARANLGKLDGYAGRLPDPQLLLKPLQRVESLTSSRLEGTYATAEELMLFELDRQQPKSANDPRNAWREVWNYSFALERGTQMLDEMPFCLHILEQMHSILLSGVRGWTKNPGKFRKDQVFIGSNRRYVPPPAGTIMETCLQQFDQYLRNPEDKFDPLVRCIIAHYQLEAIHPFSDGNGRIGRVLFSLMIYKWCDLKMPWLYLSPFFERYKDEYIDNLFNVSATGDWSKWVEFCLRGVIEQSKDAIEKCECLLRLWEDMRSDVKECPGRVAAIIDDLFKSPLVRIVDVQRMHGVSYMTAKGDIEYLVSKNILKPLQSVSVKTFYAHAIFQIAYES